MLYILSADTEDDSGAFAVDDDYGLKVIYFFEEYDDAERYLGLLEAEDYPPMKVVEIENNVAIKACEVYNYRYVVIKPDDVVIPPKNVTFSKD
ncbi:MAG: DUF3110 domain-containing protein [Candidatus Lokiarchaeota archaeon]|nr:DUF3110 domain-containing protein [Candidatus Lokiarchaeota archaeon]